MKAGNRQQLARDLDVMRALLGEALELLEVTATGLDAGRYARDRRAGAAVHRKVDELRLRERRDAPPRPWHAGT